MPDDRTSARPADDFSDNPLAWSSQMLIASDRREFRAAAEAQSELLRLGWDVRRKKARRPEGGAR